MPEGSLTAVYTSKLELLACILDFPTFNTGHSNAAREVPHQTYSRTFVRPRIRDSSGMEYGDMLYTLGAVVVYGFFQLWEL